MQLFKRKQMLEILPKNMVCVEIGVHKAQFSKQMYKILKPKKLILVDCWKEFSDNDSSITWTLPEWENIYQKVLKSFADKSNVEILRMLSVDASKKFADSSLDMIYIDANHDYEYVLEDLQCWTPKLKTGGWLCGHDYDMPGVNKAVKEFLKGKKYNVTTGEKKYKSFYYKKE